MGHPAYIHIYIYIFTYNLSICYTYEALQRECCVRWLVLLSLGWNADKIVVTHNEQLYLLSFTPHLCLVLRFFKWLSEHFGNSSKGAVREIHPTVCHVCFHLLWIGYPCVLSHSKVAPGRERQTWGSVFTSSIVTNNSVALLKKVIFWDLHQEKKINYFNLYHCLGPITYAHVCVYAFYMHLCTFDVPISWTCCSMCG